MRTFFNLRTCILKALHVDTSRAYCQWHTVAILVECSPGSQPAQNYEGSPAVVVVAYHKRSYSNTWTDWQLIIITKPRAARTLERRQHRARTRITQFQLSWQNLFNWTHW